MTPYVLDGSRLFTGTAVEVDSLGSYQALFNNYDAEDITFFAQTTLGPISQAIGLPSGMAEYRLKPVEDAGGIQTDAFKLVKTRSMTLKRAKYMGVRGPRVPAGAGDLPILFSAYPHREPSI